MISDDRELRIPLEVLIKVFIAPHYAQSFVFSLAIAAFNVRRGVVVTTIAARSWLQSIKPQHCGYCLPIARTSAGAASEHVHSQNPAFNLLSYSSLIPSAGAFEPSSSVDVICKTVYARWTFTGHKTVCNHQPGRCRPVPGVDEGSEDIQVLPNGMAFITSGVDAQSRGNILLFDFKKPRRGAHALDIVGDLDRSIFSPAGLSIWRDYNSNIIYIFVVNILADRKDTIEKFRFDEKTRKLYHLRTYRDPTFTYPDDIVATGEDSFYFTNYIKFDFKVELLRRLSLGNVCFYDGTRGHILLTGRSIPNGINTSPDGK
ncbi:Serum paraoxonase/arylesterase 1 [Lamellibrachia satsuma]|nr:Serum paraoxonase/arylesterase 1 [Lamellibrachia satsuma]